MISVVSVITGLRPNPSALSVVAVKSPESRALASNSNGEQP